MEVDLVPEMSSEHPPAGFVVRESGTWHSAAAATATPVVTDLDALLTRLADAGPSEPAVGDPLPDETTVAPIWCWIGAVTASGIVLEGNDGQRLVLDGKDLRLLDALREPTSVAALTSATGIADGPVRLGHLAAAGRLQLLDHGGSVGDGAGAPDRDDLDSEHPSPERSETPPIGPGDGRVGVHGVWLERVGPALSLGMLTAAARHWDGGALNERYEIHRPQTTDEFLAALRERSGPAVLLCSNYVWSIDTNLAIAREAKALCPDLVVIHGGPSTPKYPGDALRFLADHGDVADVLVRNEGEVTLCRVLEALTPGAPLDEARLGQIPGLTFRGADGKVARTDEPERIADLNALPSPYLTGEFDHIEVGAWPTAISVETNRGCPYGCTFCDWGSATLSRLRKFDISRVVAELEWAARHGSEGVQICDANFGIMARDVEIARGLGEIHRRTGRLCGVGFTPPKNTNKHITRIFDALMDAGLIVSTAISLQTIDEDTLAAVERSNISTDNYLGLAADLRRRGHPLSGDVLIGMPAQTYDSYKADLQFFIDHQIMARTWIIKVLPNAPMNDPAYRERFAIQTDGQGIVTSTAALSESDVARALRLRRAEVIGQRLGVIRLLGLFLQWDHGIPITDLLHHIVDLGARTPDRFPLVSWVFENFDLHPTAPVGWNAFYQEIRQLVAEDFGLDPGRADLATVLAVQTALMPAPGRRFPDTTALDHDVVAYWRDATISLYTTGHATGAPRPLASYGPTAFTVDGDPLGLCDAGLHFDGDTRDLQFESDFFIGQRTANELASPLVSILPVFSGRDSPVDATALVAEILTPERLDAAAKRDQAGDGRRMIPVRSEGRAEVH